MQSACETATTTSPGMAGPVGLHGAGEARLHLEEGLTAREAKAGRALLHGVPLRQLAELAQLGAGPLAEVALDEGPVDDDRRFSSSAIGAAVSRARSSGEA